LPRFDNTSPVLATVAVSYGFLLDKSSHETHI
jgi:hypothetical protein